MNDLDKEKEAIVSVWDRLYKKLKTIDEQSQKFEQKQTTVGIKEAMLAILYEEILHFLLTKLLNKLKNLQKQNLLSKTIINYLRNLIKENRTYIDSKKQIYLMPKVKKNY